MADKSFLNLAERQCRRSAPFIKATPPMVIIRCSSVSFLIRLAALFCSLAPVAVSAQTPVPFDSIQDADNYTVRRVIVRGRYAPNKDWGIHPGDPYTRARVNQALRNVAKELTRQENKNILAVNVRAISPGITAEVLLVTPSLVVYPGNKQVDVILTPSDLRIDPSNLLSNFLPDPRSLEPTFLNQVPKPLLLLNPRFGLSSDRRYGFAPALNLTTDLLHLSGAKSDDASKPQLLINAFGRKSFQEDFYDASVEVGLRQEKFGNSVESWGINAKYVASNNPLLQGQYLRNGIDLRGDIQLHPANSFIRKAVVGGVYRNSLHRVVTLDTTNFSRQNENALQIHSIVDSRLGGGSARMGLWTDYGLPSRSRSYQRVAGTIAFQKAFGSTNQTLDLEILAGAGMAWGDVPEYARFYGGNLRQNFLYDNVTSDTLVNFPAGPIIRGSGAGELAAPFAGGIRRGGTSFWHANLNLAIPIRAWSRKLVPEDTSIRPTLAELLKAQTTTAESAIAVGFAQRGDTGIEADRKAKQIVDKDIRPAVNYLADQANVYALKPLLLFDIANVDDTGAVGNRPRLGVGAGLQLTVVVARFEIGYVANVQKVNRDPGGNLFFRLTFSNIF